MKYFLLIVPIVIILIGLIPIIKCLYKIKSKKYLETTGKVIVIREFGGGHVKASYPVIEYYVDEKRYTFLSKYRYSLKSTGDTTYKLIYKKSDPSNVCVKTFKDDLIFIIMGIFFLIFTIHYI